MLWMRGEEGRTMMFLPSFVMTDIWAAVEEDDSRAREIGGR